MPGDHLLRRIGRALDLSWLRAELAPFRSLTGRPSIEPGLMIRMLLVGNGYGVRSERKLCEEVRYNLGHRWFLQAGMGRQPFFSLSRGWLRLEGLRLLCVVGVGGQDGLGRMA